MGNGQGASHRGGLLAYAVAVALVGTTAKGQDAPPVALPSLPPVVATPQTGLDNRHMPPPWPTDALRAGVQRWFAAQGCVQEANTLPIMARALDLTNSEALFLLRTLEEEGLVEVSQDRRRARHLHCS
jgi:hypothetical protein